MKELLSTVEIDALLEMFRSETAELPDADVAGVDLGLVGADEEQRSRVRPVDLLRPNRIGRDEMLGVERCFHNAAAAIGAAVSERLRLDVTCDCVAVEQVGFSTWVEQFVGPAGVYVLRLHPLTQPALWTVTSDLLYGAVDRILGGTGGDRRAPQDFTTAEFAVADALIGPCLDALCHGLLELGSFTWSIDARTCRLSSTQTISPYEVVLSVYLQVSGESLTGDLRLVVPLSELEPFLGSVATARVAGQRHEPGAMRATLARVLSPVPLELRASLGSVAMSLSEVARLAVGDLIVLDRGTRDEVIASVQGAPKFTGRLDRAGSHVAIRIEGAVEELHDG